MKKQTAINIWKYYWVFVVFDMLMTSWWVGLGYGSHETNPLARYFIEHGILWLFSLMALVFAGGLTHLFSRSIEKIKVNTPHFTFVKATTIIVVIGITIVTSGHIEAMILILGGG